MDDDDLIHTVLALIGFVLVAALALAFAGCGPTRTLEQRQQD